MKQGKYAQCFLIQVMAVFLKKLWKYPDLEISQLKKINSSLYYNWAGEACIAAFEGGPVVLVYFKFPDEIKKEAQKEYLDSIKRYKEGNTCSVPGSFVFGIGFK